MSQPIDRQRLESLLRGFFLAARAEHQSKGLGLNPAPPKEKRGSERKPSEQVPHPYDHVVDVLCAEFGLANPGTDGHSLNVWTHPVTGWPPELAERMRRERVRQTWERGNSEDEAWLAAEGLRLTKDGWVRRKEESYGG